MSTSPCSDSTTTTLNPISTSTSANGASGGPPTSTESPDRWQNGDCGAYAVALRSKFPHLKFGTLGEYVEDGKYFEESHYFVHDDAFAYDSLGAHPMPYRGTDIDLDAECDQETWYYDEPHPDDLAAAEAHIRVHCIGPRLRDAKHAPDGLTQA